MYLNGKVWDKNYVLYKDLMSGAWLKSDMVKRNKDKFEE